MSKNNHLLFITGKSESDMALELIQMEHGELRPPEQCYLCKRIAGDSSVGIKIMAGSIEPSTAVVDLKVDYVEATSTPDAKVFFPLCQNCRLLLDLWPNGDTKPD